MKGSGLTMQYGYGDSSASPFTSNFLELLRDALDFSVYLLEADQRIRGTRDRRDDLKRRSQRELDQLDVLRAAAIKAIESTPKGAADSAAAECATRMSSACDECVEVSAASVRRKVAGEVAEGDEEEETERIGCAKALLTLLSAHTPPESSSVLRLHLADGGSYEALLEGNWPGIGLVWTSELAVPDGHPFKQLLRVENLRHGMDITAPNQTGWIKKEVKMRSQHLERHVVSEVIAEGSKVVLRLRTEPGGDVGFDFESHAGTGRIAASRVATGQDALAAGPFDVQDEDAPKVIELCNTVRESLSSLKPIALRDARVGEIEVTALPNYVDMTERLIGYLAPFVHEIAKHSLEPDELVLRRLLANDRREEIFVSKTTLRQKYEQLPPNLHAVFKPLGLQANLSRSIPPAANAASPARSELPPSSRPPPPIKPMIVVSPKPPASPTFGSVVDRSERAPSVSSAGDGDKAPLASALKKIVELSRAGRQEEAFGECTALLESSAFTGYSPGDQRHALGLVLVLERPAQPSEALRRAHVSARTRARALVERFGDSADYELMGLCQLALDESAEATETFRKGLELERVRNPRSELCARLASRVS
jgi:hypothetical protein